MSASALGNMIAADALFNAFAAGPAPSETKASSRLASQKLERHCAILTKIAIATGEPEED
jgi:DNA-binding transcriptional regulator LsrR (DeoR family)